MSDNDETPQAAHVRQELSDQSDTLHTLVTVGRARPEGLAVGDFVLAQDILLHDWPVAGAERLVAYRTGSGFDGFTVPQSTAVPQNSLLVHSTAARLGLQIVNVGAFPVILYLTNRPVPAAGAPAIYLAANGGANSYWRGLIGQSAWCGNVSAVAVGGISTLTIAEV
jgi:hypothetical protein